MMIGELLRDSFFSLKKINIINFLHEVVLLSCLRIDHLGRDDVVAVASAGAYACKSFAPRSRQITMPAPHHSVFTGRMPFLPPNQQHQSTEGNKA